MSKGNCAFGDVSKKNRSVEESYYNFFFVTKGCVSMSCHLKIWIRHFRVAFYLGIKTYRRPKPFMRKFSWKSKTYFQMRGFARRLVLKKRQKETSEWPIKNFCIAYDYGVQKANVDIHQGILSRSHLKKLRNAALLCCLDKCGVNFWVSATFIFYV